MNKHSAIFLLLAAILIASCLDNKTKTSTTVKAKDSITNDTSFLNDNNYLYKNLTNTNTIITIFKKLASGGVDSNLFADSGYKKTYVQLNALQKTKLIAPFISQTLKVKATFPLNLIQAYFVSKQTKIGDIQPIIIHISGDDYTSLTMILLDKNGKYESGFNISGGMDAGPATIGDSLVSYETKSFSTINNDHITTSRITEIDHTDTAKKQVIIDSTVFQTLITPNGNFLTKQASKSRYQRLSK